MSDIREATICADEKGSFLYLKENKAFSNNLGLSSHLKIVIYAQEELIGEFTSSQEFYTQLGFKIALPDEVNNELAYKADECNHRFTLRVTELSPDGNELISALTFDAIVKGEFSIIKKTTQSQGISAPPQIDDEAKVKGDQDVDNPPVTPVERPAHSSGKKILIAVSSAIVLLLLAVLLVWLFLAKSGFSPSSVTTPSQEPVYEAPSEQEEKPLNTAASEDNAAIPANTAQKACSISEQTDAQIIKSCIASSPDNATIQALAKEALENSRCELAKRLLTAYGRRDGDISLTLARYFDVEDSLLSACLAKDKAQALYWYEKSAALGNQDAKNALSRLKK